MQPDYCRLRSIARKAQKGLCRVALSRFSIFIKYIIVREYGHVKSKLCQFRFQLVFELSEQKVLSFLAEIMDLCIASAVCTGKFFLTFRK